MEIDVQCSVRLEQGSKLYFQNELDYVKMYLVVQKSWKAQAVNKLQAEGPPWAVSPVTSLAWLLGCSELGGPTGGHLSFLHVTQSGSLGPSCARPWGSRTESCSPPELTTVQWVWRKTRFSQSLVENAVAVVPWA